MNGEKKGNILIQKTHTSSISRYAFTDICIIDVYDIREDVCTFFVRFMWHINSVSVSTEAYAKIEISQC